MLYNFDSSSEIVNLTAVRLFMPEGGVPKLATLYMFPRRRTNGTFAAPPVGEMYRVE